METANSPIFLKFGNAKDHQTLLNFAILAGKWQKTSQVLPLLGSDLTLMAGHNLYVWALLPVSYLQFHGITYPLVLVLFVSLLLEFGTP